MVVPKRTYFLFLLLATYTAAFDFGSIFSGVKDAIGSIGGLFGVGGGGGGGSSSPSAGGGGGG
ncbi:hypothetical protein PRIPAC_84292 [Pristionchus pacificus]|uniref:Uncharacterized protein n=1 Tax=Pristionchus pacificus TaxID=54126 RepID=A0A2A6BKC0_PRIPA|nr:hypothetical protein PRIPAC_84292 [Pristionchus pacificus]|eukprot:PDM66349.1 hypothetical protein PRIPAC_47766 [Pristionchus pacificus]